MTLDELQTLDFRCYVTATGFNYEATAKATTKTVNIAYIQLGAGMLPASESPITLTEMVDSYGEAARFNASVKEDPDNPGGFIAQAIIPADHNIDGKGYVINEAAAVLDNGIIYAYRRVESDFKLVGQGSAKSYVIRLRFRPANADVIHFTIDPSAVFVTESDLDAEMKRHENASDPHPKYLKEDDLKGHSEAPNPHPQYELKSAYAQHLSNATGGKWVVHESQNGTPCVFYRMPAFTYETLNIEGCPFTGPVDVFRNADGSTKPFHDFPVYMASEKGGDLVSVGGGVPVHTISFDEFMQRASDSGFAMYSVYERACINWLMVANNYQPIGNTIYGRSHEGIQEFGRREDGKMPGEQSGSARTLTGSGPACWNHDGTEHGIADLVGNQWEWCDDFKMSDGEFVIAEHCGQPESDWIRTGRFIAPGHVFAMANRGDARSNQTWSAFTKEDGYEGHDLLQRLCIEPIDCTRILNGRFYYDTSGERSPFVGGYWGNGSGAGPAALYLVTPRSYRHSDLGGRLAFRAL